MGVVGVDHVQLAMPAGGEGEARAFYNTLLGLEELDKPEILKARGGVWFAAGINQIHLGVEADFNPAKKAHPGLLVRDIMILGKKLSEAGIQVDWDENLPHYRRFYSEDPFGNRLEFLEPIPLADDA